MEPIEQNEPMEAIDPKEPADPIDRTDPVEQIESTESVEAIDHRDRDLRGGGACRMRAPTGPSCHGGTRRRRGAVRPAVW
jgi:hypothetical protein